MQSAAHKNKCENDACKNIEAGTQLAPNLQPKFTKQASNKAKKEGRKEGKKEGRADDKRGGKGKGGGGREGRGRRGQSKLMQNTARICDFGCLLVGLPGVKGSSLKSQILAVICTKISSTNC